MTDFDVRLIETLAGVLVAFFALLGLVIKFKGDRTIALERARVAELEAKVHEREAMSAKRELQAQAYFLSFGAYLHDWQSIEHEALAIIRETEVDRILLFQAWNGEHDPQHTTAVCQFREAGQTLVSYRMVSLDLDYQSRVRQMKREGGLHFTVSAVPPSLIRSVYDAEGVKSSYWLHISSLTVPNTGAAAIGYASYSSTTAEIISDNTQTRCKLLNNRLSGLARSYESSMIG